MVHLSFRKVHKKIGLLAPFGICLPKPGWLCKRTTTHIQGAVVDGVCPESFETIEGSSIAIPRGGIKIQPGLTVMMGCTVVVIILFRISNPVRLPAKRSVTAALLNGVKHSKSAILKHHHHA